MQQIKNLLTNADSSTNTKKNPACKAKLAKKNLLGFARQFYILYEQKFSNLRPFLSLTFPQGFQKSLDFMKWGQKDFKRSEQMKKENC